MTAAYSKSTVKAPVRSSKPDPEAVQHTVETSRGALRRGLRAIKSTGVKIRRKKDVPLFYSDIDRPGYFIRELNGQIESGVLDGSEFKVVV